MKRIRYDELSSAEMKQLKDDYEAIFADALKDKTGYTVEDTYESLASLFDTWGSQDFEKNYVEKCKDCERIWNSKYINYGKDVLVGEYISFLQNC